MLAISNDTVADLKSMLNAVRPTALTTCSSDPHSSLFLRELIQVFVAVVVTCIVMTLYQRHRSAKVQHAHSGPTILVKRPHGSSALFRQTTLTASTLTASTLTASTLTASTKHKMMCGAFLSSVIAELWHHVNIAVSDCIKETLDPLLSGLAVPIHFVKLDLGNVPIRTENMSVHQRTSAAADEEDEYGVQIDLDVVWDGTPDIMLQAVLAKPAGHITFGVRRLKLAGRMHMLFSPLTTALPVITAVQYGFTNPPTIELDFAGVAQSIAKHLAFVEPAIMSIVQGQLANMLVLPYRMMFPVDVVKYDYLDTYQPPVGTVRISVEKGRGFTILKRSWGNDVPDLYCLVSLGGSSHFRTSTQWNDYTPSWLGETCDFVLYDLDQKIYVQVHDDGLSRADSRKELGRAEISARHLFQGEKAGTTELELAFGDDLHTGCYITVSAEMFALSEELQSLTSSNYRGDHHVCGLITILVTGAFDIPLHKEDASTYVKVVSRHKTFFTPVITPDYPDNLDPVYSSAFHIPLTMDINANEATVDTAETAEEDGSLNAEEVSTRRSPTPSRRTTIMRKSLNIVEKGLHWPKSGNSEEIVFSLMNDNSSNSNAPSELGSFTVTHEALLRADDHTITEVRPIGPDGASLGFRVVLSGVQSEEEKSRQNNRTETQLPNPSHDPVASTIADPVFAGNSKKHNIRITALKGRGFHVDVRNLLIGTAHDIQDIYCCIRLLEASQPQQPLDSPCWRTSTIKDDTMPQWNESETFAIANRSRDIIRVDAYNENRAREDEYLGTAEYRVNKLLRKRVIEMELKIGKKSTGSFVTLKGVIVSASAGSGPALPQSQSLESISEKDDNINESFARRRFSPRKISTLSKHRINRKSLKKAVSLPSKESKSSL